MVFPKDCLKCTWSSINDCTFLGLTAILVGILVLLVVAPIQAHPLIPSGNSQNFEYKRYCSTSLSDVVRLLCGGHINSQQNAQHPLNSHNFKRVGNDDGGIYSKTAQAERIHECCLRPCGYSELKMYCAPV